MKVPFAVCSVNTLAAQGSIPADTLPDSFELLTVGAMAVSYTHLTLPTNREV